jgi:hypothetical protein
LGVMTVIMKNKLVLTLTKADIKYKRIAISAALYRSNEDFFPKNGIDFTLQTDVQDVGTIRTHLRKSTPHKISKGLRPWFRAHDPLPEVARVEFEKITRGIFSLNLI